MNKQKEKFISEGWKYINSISDKTECSDRSCIKCRIADILFEIENTPLVLRLLMPTHTNTSGGLWSKRYH